MLRVVALDNNKKLILGTLLNLRTERRRDVCLKFVEMPSFMDLVRLCDREVYDTQFDYTKVLRDCLISNIQLVGGGDDMCVFVHYDCQRWRESWCDNCCHNRERFRDFAGGEHSTSFNVTRADSRNLILIDKWASTIMD